MTKDYLKFIKELRIKKDLAQAEIAEKIGISRSSYISFEQGKTELNMTEAAKLADILGVSLEEMKSGLKPNYNKYKQMILAYLRADQDEDGKIPKTKLAKLLYLADFAWFYKYQESMSGMTYRKFAYGPVSDTYLSLIEEMEVNGELNITQVLREDYHMYEITETRASQKIKLNLLSREEKALVKTIWKKWQTSDTNEIVRFTQNQLPFTLAEDNGRLSYRAILKEEVAHIY